ncbi:hypothetical protein ACFC58_36145 [Kitasatospora purpeofusca]|uniref:hypothetical protein n=1 Tax=Kitasatospora purpeofusca TaxID=67352 RepID=UPI0035DEF589
MPSSLPTPPTYEQLHGTACIVCGGPGDDLTPAGHAYTPNGPGEIHHGWAVRRHPVCRRPEEDQ